MHRILEPHKNIDYWTESIIFTNINNSLGATELNYLEYRLYEIALDADRFKVTNGGTPHKGIITEEKEDEMEDFIDSIRLILRTLGRKVFEPVVNKAPDSLIEEKIFKTRSKKIIAFAKFTDDGFVVLKGSQIVNKITRSAPKQVHKLREKYEDYIDNSFALIKDIRFSSPSAAAGFIGGSSINGNDYWVTEEGLTLGKYLSNTSIVEEDHKM